MWKWSYQEWVQTSAQFHEQLVLVIPIAAATATYLAGRITPATRIFSLPSSARSGAPVVVRHIGLLSTAFVASYCLGFLPIFMLTIIHAQVGGPDVLAFGSGMLALIMAVAVGYCIGALTASAWLAPLTFLLAFLAVQSTGYEPNKFAAVDPVTHFKPTLGRFEALPISLYRIAFFTLVIATAVLVCARALETRSRSQLISPTILLLVASVCIGVFLPTQWRPAILAEEANPPSACTTSDGISYCVHAGHRTELATVVDSANAIFQLVGQVPPGITRIRDAALATPSDDTLRSDTIWLHLNPTSSTREATIDGTAQQVSGYLNCPVATGVNSPAIDAAYQLFMTLLSSSGTPMAGNDQPAHISNAALRSWFEQHQQHIYNCSLNNGPGQS
jgi:hypothetical protein